MKATNKTLALLAAAALLVALLVALTFLAFRQIEQTTETQRHANKILNSADDLLSALKDAETGMRGYVLTGDEDFLQPYLMVRNNVRGQLQQLRQLALLGTTQTQLDALVPLVDAKLLHISLVIDLRRKQGMTASLTTIRSGKGQHLMDAIRAEMSSFIKLEENALVQREAELKSGMRRLFAIIVGASVLTLLFSAAFAWLFYRETQQQVKNLLHLETLHLLKAQEETNKQLQQTNLSLQLSEEKFEVTLNSIGDAVIATDAEARVTLLNPLAEQLTGWTQAQARGRPVAEIFIIINKETRLPATIPVMETLEHGTVQGLANHTVLIAVDGSECDIADSCAPIRDRNNRVVGAVLVFRNVSEEYALQQALRDSSAQMQTILNTVVDGIVTLHANGGMIETINPAAERMFGYTSAELRGQNFSLLIPELHQYQRNGSLNYYSASDEARASGLGREVSGQRKDGSSFPLEIAVSEMWLGGQRYFTGILRDISTRKQAEAALLKAGALQKAIFDSANFSSIATDAKGVIQIFNVGAERMLGYAAADVMNKITPADISDPDEVVARARSLSAELGTPITPGFEALVFKATRGIEDIYELTYIRKDGSRLPAVVSVTALRDEQNAIIGYLLIGTDNTARIKVEAERQKLDQRLRDQQFYTRSLIESSIDALITTDPSGIISDANKQMEILTGCTRDELIGSSFKKYFTDAERAEAGIKLVLSEKKVTDYELTAHARNGHESVVSYNATTYYDRNRKLQGVFAVARDVTERKRLDQALLDKNAELERARTVAEKANLAKSDFLSSMSHELRTPLNAILGFAQLLDAGKPEPTEAQSMRLHQILKAGWYLLELINEILDLAAIESGKLALSREPVSLIEVMRECQGLVESQAKSHGIRITFALFDPGLVINADRTRVKQILVNLITNAIKYNRQHGTVEIACAQSSADTIRISVNDSGAGLSAEKLEQLFQPFNRLGQENGTEEGTGIGLAVCKKLVELMGGSIGVKSTVGVGSEFWFKLLGSTESMPDSKMSILSGSGLHRRINTRVKSPANTLTLLYVEDNPANLLLVEETIGEHPHIHLLSARDGLLGIELARSHLPDVILMDINLPGISGIETLKRLRADPATAHIPVIAISANAMHDDIEKCLKAGFYRYLTKPIKIHELLDALSKALEHSETEMDNPNESEKTT